MLKSMFKKMAVVALVAAMPTWALSQGADPFSAANLNKAPTTAWITNNGNLKGQRYTPLNQINLGNVAQLKAEWRVHLDGSGMGANMSQQATPLFYDGILYQVTGQNDVFAINVENGEFLWKYKPQVDPAKVAVCCSWVSRGLGIGDGKIYLGRVDGKIDALDIKTGALVWSIQPVVNTDGYSITAAPLYYKDMVIQGYAGGEYGIRGKIEAFSSKDGRKLWTFYTIPGPGEVGHDSWPQDNDFWKFGGAPIWQTPTIDSDTDTIYFSTGNPGPDLNGSARAGDNLFSVSVLALDVNTGHYKWHFQEVHHDIWDYDSPNPTILFDYVIDGVMRHGISNASKSGLNYILDRTTGQPLIGIPEVAVPQMASQKTSPTQPIPLGDSIVPTYIDYAPQGFTLINQGRVFTPFGTSTAEQDRVLYKPLAGVNWPPPAYDPETNTAFFCASDRIGGGRQGASEVADGPPIGPNGAPRSWMEGSFVSTTVPGRGLFVAQSLSTNKNVWAVQLNSPCHQGGLATAGGILFIGRNDGRMTALDKTTGAERWSFMTDSGVNGSPISFEWKGTQYVAVLAGGTGYANNVKGDSVWLFSLKGAIGPITPPGGAAGGRGGPGGAAAPAAGAAGRGGAAPGAAPAAGAPAAAGPAAEIAPPPGRRADLTAGQAIFDQRCRSCHGDTAEAGEAGPGIPKASTLAYIMTTVSRGKAGGMPTFSSELTLAQIQDVASYVHDTLLPKHLN